MQYFIKYQIPAISPGMAGRWIYTKCDSEQDMNELYDSFGGPEANPELTRVSLDSEIDYQGE